MPLPRLIVSVIFNILGIAAVTMIALANFCRSDEAKKRGDWLGYEGSIKTNLTPFGYTLIVTAFRCGLGAVIFLLLFAAMH